MSDFEEDIPPLFSTSERIKRVIDRLPVLLEDIVALDDSCPICLNTFGAIFLDTSVEPQYRGVTQLEGCGHFFCRKDLVQWIRDRHGSCPTCRHVFLDIPRVDDLEHGEIGLIEGGDIYWLEEEYEEEEEDYADHEWFTEADLDPEFDEAEGEVGPEFDDPGEWGAYEGDAFSDGASSHDPDDDVGDVLGRDEDNLADHEDDFIGLDD